MGEGEQDGGGGQILPSATQLQVSEEENEASVNICPCIFTESVHTFLRPCVHTPFAD